MNTIQPKRVLAVCYSQTGQLSRIAETMLLPLRQAGLDVHCEFLRPVVAYPFPWPALQFFDAFPESAHLVAPELEPLGLTEEEKFDLVIIFYQVWFLAPSLPVTGFLKHPLAAKLLKDKPVVTVIGCRNMWLLAQEKMKEMLADIGARLIDNVVLTDKANMAATFITTPRWLLTGRKDGFWGMPPAGVPAEDIARTARFGRTLADALANGQETSAGPLLAGLAAVTADPKVLVSEQAGTRGFYLWGKLIRAFGGPGAPARRPVVMLYVVFLATAIVTLVPASLLIQALIRPLVKNRLAEVKARFELPSGSLRDRMPQYE